MFCFEGFHRMIGHPVLYTHARIHTLVVSGYILPTLFQSFVYFDFDLGLCCWVTW